MTSRLPTATPTAVETSSVVLGFSFAYRRAVESAVPALSRMTLNDFRTSLGTSSSKVCTSLGVYSALADRVFIARSVIVVSPVLDWASGDAIFSRILASTLASHMPAEKLTAARENSSLSHLALHVSANPNAF
jgi:hypothetical protein